MSCTDMLITRWREYAGCAILLANPLPTSFTLPDPLVAQGITAPICGEKVDPRICLRPFK